jgi:hypothetical protein
MEAPFLRDGVIVVLLEQISRHKERMFNGTQDPYPAKNRTNAIAYSRVMRAVAAADKKKPDGGDKGYGSNQGGYGRSAGRLQG